MKFYVFLISTMLFSVHAFADDCPEGVVRCGATDDGLSWEISNIKDENGNDTQQLTITGTGAMKDYTRSGDTRAPWKDYSSDGTINTAPGITNIVIGDGITAIGARAFEDMWNVTSVSLPDGLKSIGREACNGCVHLSEINLPSSLETLAPYAFYYTQISNINLPENLKTIQLRVFGNAYLLSDITIPEGVNINGLAFEDEAGNAIVQNVYCSGDNASCQALKNRESMAGKVQFYHSDGNVYFYGNHWYASPNDIIGDNHIKKRIYTIDEANRVAGTRNRISIKYR